MHDISYNCLARLKNIETFFLLTAKSPSFIVQSSNFAYVLSQSFAWRTEPAHLGSKTNASKEECTPFVGTIDVVGNLFFICEASTRSEIYRRGNACELQMEMYYLNFWKAI